MKTPVPQACNFIKKEALAQEFPVNFVKFLRTSFFIEQLCWLLLAIKGLKGNKIQELQPSSKFVTEVLIFRRSRSRMFSNIGALKKFAIFTGKHLCWPLQTFFYRTPIVTASKFSRQQILFIADRHTGFCSELLRKHDLNLRSSRWNSSVKKVFLEILLIS